MNKKDHFLSINFDIKPDSKLKVQKWNFDSLVKFVELEAWGKNDFDQTNKNDLFGKLYVNKIFCIELKRYTNLEIFFFFLIKWAYYLRVILMLLFVLVFPISLSTFFCERKKCWDPIFSCTGPFLTMCYKNHH